MATKARSETLRKAPRGQIRILAVDRDGTETIECDCWSEESARGYLHEIADDRPWITFFLVDQDGRELDGHH